MTDIPSVGVFCAGKTPLALADSICCAHKLMNILKENGFGVGACHTLITEPYSGELAKKAEETLAHMCHCCDLVITVGCDGFSVSDIMPDITKSVCDKGVEYFISALDDARRQKRLATRAYSGVCCDTLVVNLPSDTAFSADFLRLMTDAVGVMVYKLSGKSAAGSVQFKKFLTSSLDFHEVFKKECIVNY